MSKGGKSKSRRDADKRRKTSLFRKLSSKKAATEMQQLQQQHGLSGSQSLQVGLGRGTNLGLLFLDKSPFIR